MTIGRRWVFLDETGGAPAQNRERLTPAALAVIADVVQMQNNLHYAPTQGTPPIACRVGRSPKDVRPGESVFAFLPELPGAPGDIAYHDTDGQGVPVAFEAIPLCASLLGPGGASSSAGHEADETEGDPPANRWAFNPQTGLLHALEECDAIEMQEYPLKCGSATAYVPNFLLASFFAPGSSGPFTFMTLADLPGAVEPAAPFATAPGQGGNYQLVMRAGREGQITARRGEVGGDFASGAFVLGTPRRAPKTLHWSSRLSRRLAQLAAGVRP